MDEKLSNNLKIVRVISWEKTISNIADFRGVEGKVKNDELFCTVCKQRIGFDVEKIPFCRCEWDGDIYDESAIPGYDITKQTRIEFFNLPWETRQELKKELIKER